MYAKGNPWRRLILHGSLELRAARTLKLAAQDSPKHRPRFGGEDGPLRRIPAFGADLRSQSFLGRTDFLGLVGCLERRGLFLQAVVQRHVFIDPRLELPQHLAFGIRWLLRFLIGRRRGRNDRKTDEHHTPGQRVSMCFHGTSILARYHLPDEAIPPLRFRQLACVKATKDPVAGSGDESVDRVSQWQRNDVGHLRENAPAAFESVEGQDDRSRSRECALVRQTPVRHHDHGIEVRRVEAMLPQRPSGELPLKRREPQHGASIARQEKPHQPIAQTADPVEKDDCM